MLYFSARNIQRKINSVQTIKDQKIKTITGREYKIHKIIVDNNKNRENIYSYRLA